MSSDVAERGAAGAGAPTAASPNETAQAFRVREAFRAREAYCLVGVVVGIVVTALNSGPAGPLVLLASILMLALVSAGPLSAGGPPA